MFINGKRPSTATAFCVLALMVCGASATADPQYLPEAKVQILLQRGDSTFGGCMARLDVYADQVGCNANRWVSFGCDGSVTGVSKSGGYAMFDLATAASILNKSVNVYVSGENLTSDGICTVTDIRLIPQG